MFFHCMYCDWFFYDYIKCGGDVIMCDILEDDDYEICLGTRVPTSDEVDEYMEQDAEYSE
jgi:hypothetical protein